MDKKIHSDFFGTILVDEELHTAMKGNFYNGFTAMRYSDLTDSVEGADKVLDVVLKELLSRKAELEQGEQVNVYVEWELSDDKKSYLWAKPLKVEIEK